MKIDYKIIIDNIANDGVFFKRIRGSNRRIYFYNVYDVVSAVETIGVV